MRYAGMGDFLLGAVDSFAVYDLVNVIDGGLDGEGVPGVAFDPAGFKSIGVVSAAFKAGAVAGGQGRGLVQEEKLRPAVGAHDGSFPAFKFQHAYNPGFVFEWFNDLLVFMDNATVTHPCAAGVGLDESS
jgi:hypothetical protein